jgi:hydroxymethylpyrimidine/phosphomethylpyrimidine kinase
MTTQTPPVTLTIAGSDCSGGAGIQADLKTFQDFSVHGLTAITSIVAETPLEVRHIEPVDIPLLQTQINMLLEAYPVAAVKTGLLPSRMSIIAVAEIFKDRQISLVIDPVMVASAGTSLLPEDAAAAFGTRLLPCATLVTPNIPEAERILKRSIATQADMEHAACDISGQYQISCFLKGGHLPGKDDRLDVLRHNGETRHFRHACIELPGGGIHGTGCTLSAAITAGLARKQPMEQAVADAVDYVQKLIRSAHSWEGGSGHEASCLGW